MASSMNSRNNDPNNDMVTSVLLTTAVSPRLFFDFVVDLLKLTWVERTPEHQPLRQLVPTLVQTKAGFALASNTAKLHSLRSCSESCRHADLSGRAQVVRRSVLSGDPFAPKSFASTVTKGGFFN